LPAGSASPVAGKGGFPHAATYCATKRPVDAMVDALRSPRFEVFGPGVYRHD
jgi:NADP-dependent 3-hydroxy acid dehydrogenase YdfG